MLRPETDPSVGEAANVLADSINDSGATITTVAEKWVPGVSALLGLAGLTTVIVAKDTVSAFDLFWRSAIFILVVVAISTAALATIWIYRAAFGWPKDVRLSSVADVVAAAASVRSRAIDAARKFRASVRLAIASTAALLAALAILWFQPSVPEIPTARITFATPGPGGASASERCVQIVAVAKGVLQAKVLTGGPTDTLSIPVNQLMTLDLASCE